MKLTMTNARECVLKARAELGHNLSGYSVEDLLCDNFIDASIEDCHRVAAQLRKDKAI